MKKVTYRILYEEYVRIKKELGESPYTYKYFREIYRDRSMTLEKILNMKKWEHEDSKKGVCLYYTKYRKQDNIKEYHKKYVQESRKREIEEKIRRKREKLQKASKSQPLKLSHNIIASQGLFK